MTKQFRIIGIKRNGKKIVENWNNCEDYKVQDIKHLTRFCRLFYRTWKVEYREV